jgi:hypothetical protein
MAALYEPHAVFDCGDGQLTWAGAQSGRYARMAATGRKFELGDQRPAIISGGVALTSTRLPDGNVTAEIARRQSDGAWLWVIDQFSLG